MLNQFINHTMKSCEVQQITKNVSLWKLYFYDHVPKQEVDTGKINFLVRAYIFKNFNFWQKSSYPLLRFYRWH